MSQYPSRHNGKSISEGPVETPFGKPLYESVEMPFNPFHNNSAPVSGILEYIRLVLMLPIFLLRLALLLVMFLLGYLFTKIALVGATDMLSKPFPPWRRTLLWPVRFCARGVLFACGFQWIKVKGEPAARDVAPILVSNHCSFVDPVFIFYAFLPIIMTAKENIDIPIAGAIQEALQCIPVDRSSPTSRKDAAGEIKRRAVCNDWSHVAIFPEATTTNGRALVSFKMGAFACGLPIQPLVVRYPHVRTDPSWVVDGPPVHLLLIRLMMEVHNYMEVEYLPVVQPSLKELAHPHDFANRTRLLMASALNVHLTDHAFGDVALTVEALKLKAPASVGNVEFGRMERMKVDMKEAKGLLRNFLKMEGARSGKVSRKGYASSLHLPMDDSLLASFAIFDVNGNGSFSFREYLSGVALMKQHPGSGKAGEAVFQMWDSDMGGELSEEKVKEGARGFFPEITEEQGSALFKAMGGGTEGIVSWNEFRAFLANRPEYLAAFVCANPSILIKHEDEGKAETSGRS